MDADVFGRQRFVIILFFAHAHELHHARGYAAQIIAHSPASGDRDLHVGDDLRKLYVYVFDFRHNALVKKTVFAKARFIRSAAVCTENVQVGNEVALHIAECMMRTARFKFFSGRKDERRIGGKERGCDESFFENGGIFHNRLDDDAAYPRFERKFDHEFSD